MTIEQLNSANSLRWSITDIERTSEILNKATVCIDKNKLAFGFNEDSIELLPEEQDELESLRQAYLTVLRTANNRKLGELKSQFDAI
jgi:hypothetical protein